MLVRLILSAAIALGLTAGVAQACQCRPVVHPVVRPRPRPACVPCRPISYHHHYRRRVITRVIDRTVHIEKYEGFSDDRAYRYAEADPWRWGLRPSPPHPWDTDRSGFLTWSGKERAYAIEDRYSGEPRDDWEHGWEQRWDDRSRDGGCPDRCAPRQTPLVQP
jgi:hypothetical protein